LVTVPLMLSITLFLKQSWLVLVAELTVGMAAYLLLNKLLSSKTQEDVLHYLLHSFKKPQKADDE